MVPSPGLDSWWWRFIENYVYRVPEPPPRTRTTPMQVICVGPPRSGTESLQQALGSMSLEKCPDPGAFERANYMKILQGWRA